MYIGTGGRKSEGRRKGEGGREGGRPRRESEGRRAKERKSEQGRGKVRERWREKRREIHFGIFILVLNYPSFFVTYKLVYMYFVFSHNKICHSETNMNVILL